MGDGGRGYQTSESYTKDKWGGGIPWSGKHDDPVKFTVATISNTEIRKVTLKKQPKFASAPLEVALAGS